MKDKKGKTYVNQQLVISLIILFAFFWPLEEGFIEAEVWAQDKAPVPLLEKGHPVDWWFVFKFNAAAFPECGENIARDCPFGGEPQKYKAFGQQYIFASSENPELKKGAGCVGETTSDPLGATFDEIYHGDYYYVLWNDQFYKDPPIKGCAESCSSPWGHAKGLMAWNDAGEGITIQVTTPSWPASGSVNFPRKTDGNTLGCVEDNNVKVSQHFFALRLSKNDTLSVLKALQNASVVTDVTNRQIVRNGGPEEVQVLVQNLGKKTHGKEYMKANLSSGVILISKPSDLNVPPWQMVSAILDGTPLRTATWWQNPEIYSTTDETKITCWDEKLGKPGAVEIATTGQWEDQSLGLKGGPGNNSNHAKIGVSTLPGSSYSIFGDLNQQGTLSPDAKKKCSSSQNGRGGTFFVLDNKILFDSLTNLIKGETAPTASVQK